MRGSTEPHEPRPPLWIRPWLHVIEPVSCLLEQIRKYFKVSSIDFFFKVLIIISVNI